MHFVHDSISCNNPNNMDGMANGEGVKTLHLHRALSGGFGFSLMGGKGTSFPPVICDVLSNSPASRCDQMQVGDIILEINGEAVEGKTTKEVVTSLMRSPDDLVLKVKEDTETKTRVLTFLEPLENPPGSNSKIRVKSIGRTSPKHKQQQSKEQSPTRTPSEPSPPTTPNERTAAESSPENGGTNVDLESPSRGDVDPSIGQNNGDKSTHEGSVTTQRLSDVDLQVKQCKSGSVIIVETPNSNKQSPVKSKSTHPPDHRIGTGAPINGISKDQLRVRDVPSSRQVYAANAYSFSSDSSVSDIPSVQVMTTVAQIHREDSSLTTRTSEAGIVDMMDGQLHSCFSSNHKRDTTGSDYRHNDINRNKMPTVTLAESESSQSELSSQASSCPSEGPLSESPLRTQKLTTSSRQSSGRDSVETERPTPIDVLIGDKETDSVAYDSGYASTSSVAKQCPSVAHSQSTQTNLDSDANRLVENSTEEQEAGASVYHGSEATEHWNGGMGPRTSSEHSVNSEESECLDMDSLGNALQAGNKNLDVPSAQRLAKRLFMLDGFKRSDVSRHLSKRNDFSKLVAEEYVTYFDFTNLPLDIALRKFISKIAISGETQERERVLLHFSTRYQNCNEIEYRSVDAVHTLTCALMLLNTDLHGQNIGKRMTFSSFVSNLEGLNEGEDFSKESLKTFYQSIKSKPLEWACDPEEKLLKRGSKTGNGTMTLSGNPFLEVQNDPNAPVYIKGYVMRKVTRDAEGKKTPRGKRAWKMFYATLKGLILYLHKSEMHHQMHFNTPKEAVSIHHSLASKVSDYSKRPNVFNLRLANWKEFFIQCLPCDKQPQEAVSASNSTQGSSDTQDLQNWMQALNLAAAVHSAPPLPAAVGLQKTFRRPLLPSAPTKLNMQEQLANHERKVESIEQELDDHRTYPPDQGQRTSVMKDYQLKQEYLEYELARFKTYIYLLHSQPALPIGKYTLEEVMPQPGQSVDSMSSSSTSSASSEGTQGSSQTKIFFGFGCIDTDSDDTDEDDSDDEISLRGDEEDVFLPINQKDEMTKL